MRKLLVRPDALFALAVVLGIAAHSPDASADVTATLSKSSIGPENGEDIYRHTCQGCHMPDGRGATGAAIFPTFAHNKNLANFEYPIAVVLNGFGGMPWFDGELSDLQISAVVNYIRTHFGNDYKDLATAADVASARGPASPLRNQ